MSLQRCATPACRNAPQPSRPGTVATVLLYTGGELESVRCKKETSALLAFYPLNMDVKGPGCMALWQVMQHDLSNATTARLSCGQLVCLPNSDSLGGYFSR